MAKKDVKKTKKADKATKGKAKKSGSSNDLSDLINQAAALEDHATATKGGGGGNFTPAAEGKTVGRLVGYIDLGLQKQRPYQGKPKKPAEEVILRFELLKDKNKREIEVDGKSKTIYDTINVRIKKSTNENSAFYKLFDKMRDGRDSITHMAQMLGEAFVVRVTHEKFKKDGKDVVFATLQNKKSKGEYNIEPPYNEDEDGERTKVKCGAATEAQRLLIWKLPTLESWNSLGEGDSYYQKLIMKAEDFPHSKLYELLEGADALPDIEDSEDEEDTDVEDDEDDEDEDTDDSDDSSDSDDDDEDTDSEDVEDDEDEEEDDEDSDDEDDSDEDEDEDEEDEESDEDEEEDDESDDDDDDVEDDEDEEEEEEEEVKKPAKKSAKAPAKKASGKKSASTAEKKSTSKASAKSAKTASPSKATKSAKGKAGSAKAKKDEDAMAILGLKKKK